MMMKCLRTFEGVWSAYCGEGMTWLEWVENGRQQLFSGSEGL